MCSLSCTLQVAFVTDISTMLKYIQFFFLSDTWNHFFFSLHLSVFWSGFRLWEFHKEDLMHEHWGRYIFITCKMTRNVFFFLLYLFSLFTALGICPYAFSLNLSTSIVVVGEKQRAYFFPFSNNSGLLLFHIHHCLREKLLHSVTNFETEMEFNIAPSVMVNWMGVEQLNFQMVVLTKFCFTGTRGRNFLTVGILKNSSFLYFEIIFEDNGAFQWNTHFE